MKKQLLKLWLFTLLLVVGGVSPAWADDKTVVKYSFDDAMSPSLTAGSRVSFDYDKTSVITSTKFLNAWNNANGDPGATTVSLGSTDLSGETWTLSFEWAACGGCNSKPDHTTLKAGDKNLFDLTGNSNWNTTVTITYDGSDGTKTLPVPGCDKNKRFKADVGDQLNTTAYWHHIVVTGSASGVKMTITNSSTGTAVVEDVLLSATNVNPTSLIIEPCCGGAIGIDELSLTYFVEGEVIQTPTANYTAVNGTERTITATCDTEGATLYYSTDGENWTEGASVTVSESGNVYFKAVKGNSESDVVTFAAVAGEAITLNAPTIVRSDNTTVTISADQTNLLLSPTATIKYTYGNEAGEFTGSKTLTVAAEATITAYAEATGYTTSATSERAVALFPEYVNTVENTPAVTNGTTTFALSTETITVSEREYAALLLDDVQWGTNVYLQNLTISDPIVWGIRNGNWYINTTNSQWILIRNLKAGDIVVLDITSPAANMVNATYSEKLSFGNKHAYVVEADGDVELDLRKTNSKEMKYFYGVYAYRENSATIAVTAITLSKTSASLTTGEELTLTATIAPEDATDKTITWTSDDETVATVSDGVVTTLKAGTATITAHANDGSGVTATCVITVTDEPNVGEHYIYSAVDGKFLSRGADWGTRAIADNYGVPANFILSDGAYNIKFIDNEVYLNAGGYTDGAIDGDNTLWIIEEAEGGFLLKNKGNGKYAKITDGNVDIDGTAETATVWSFKTPEEQAAILATKQLADHIAIAAAADKEVATEEAFATLISENYVGQDVTATYLGSDNLNGGNAGDWTVNGVRKLDQDWAAFVGGGNGVTESFSASATLTKELTGLTEGIYKVTMNGFFRQGNNGVCWNMKEAGFLPSTVYLQAGNYATPLKAWGVSATKNGDSYTPDNTAQAATAFNNGDYVNEVYTYVGEDGNLTLSVNIPNFISWAGWACFNNVQLTYYVPKSSSIDVTGIALNETSASLNTGDVLTLTATITPENATDQSVTWTSSDENVATVSGGVVSAVGAGTATITAQAVGGDNVTATCTFTVTDAPALAYTTAISGTGKYLLRNVATGKYLNAANAWGTQASLADHGVLFTATLDDGAYKLTDFVTSSTGLGADAYLDQTPVDVTVAAVNGKTNVYTLSLAEGTYLAGQAGSTVVTKDATDATSSLAQWQFISEDDMKKNMATATAENPIDMTYFIMDPNFSRNNGYYSNWTFEASNKNNAGDNTNFCVESYHATFTMSQTLTVPNGTYRLRGQAFYRQDGSDNENLPYFFANDQKATFPERTGTENSMSAASTAFTNGLYYSDYATVTVTDNTLTVGAKLETNTTLWCIWDNISLEMIGYIPVTEIAATIDNAEFEVLETAQVTATTTPEVTSFGVTYSSSDESVATVDNTGKVTGVGPGTATITVAGEIETSVTATVDVTVTSVPLITEAVNLDFAQGPVITSHIRTYEKDKTDSDLAQMQAVTGWSFGVANGDAKAAGVMAYGSSYGMGSNSSSFYAPATNPSGEASGNALGMVGVWTAPVQYVQSVKIPAGAYVLTIPVYRNGGATALTKNLIGVILDNNTEYLATTTTYAANTWTTETIRFAVEEDTYGQLSIGFNAPNVGSDNSQRLWVDAINVEFEPFATENEIAALNNAIQEAEAKTLGFQKDEYAPYNNVAPLTSLTAAKSIDTSKSVGQSTVTNATTELTGANWVANTEEVNAIYDGTFASATNNGAPAGWTMSNNTLGGDLHSRAFVGDDRLSEFNNTNSALFIRFDGTNSNRGSMYYYGNTEGYTMPLKADTYYRVTVDFAGWGSTGKPLRLNVTGPEGFSAVGQQYNTSVRADNADNAPQQFNIVFRTAGAGNYVINFQTPGADTNTHNAVISNLRLFTEPESNPTLAVTAAKYGTFVAPFDVTMPDGVIAYTVTEGDGSQLTLTSKATQGDVLPANTPVVVFSEEPVSKTFHGYSLATADSYQKGALVGTYTEIQAPNGSYILQNQNGKVGFFRVDTSVATPKVKANRAYLTSASGARASFFFEDAIVGIDAIEMLTSGEAQVFDMNGVQQPRLKKGLNILRAKDGRTTKVMVK